MRHLVRILTFEIDLLGSCFDVVYLFLGLLWRLVRPLWRAITRIVTYRFAMPIWFAYLCIQNVLELATAGYLGEPLSIKIFGLAVSMMGLVFSACILPMLERRTRNFEIYAIHESQRTLTETLALADRFVAQTLLVTAKWLLAAASA